MCVYSESLGVLGATLVTLATRGLECSQDCLKYWELPKIFLGAGLFTGYSVFYCSQKLLGFSQEKKYSWEHSKP